MYLEHCALHGIIDKDHPDPCAEETYLHHAKKCNPPKNCRYCDIYYALAGRYPYEIEEVL